MSTSATIVGFADSDAWTRLHDGTIVGKPRDTSYKETARKNVPIEVLVDESTAPDVESVIYTNLSDKQPEKQHIYSSERMLSHKDCRKTNKKKDKTGKRRSHSNKKPMHYRTISSKLRVKSSSDKEEFEEEQDEYYDAKFWSEYQEQKDDDYYDEDEYDEGEYYDKDEYDEDEFNDYDSLIDDLISIDSSFVPRLCIFCGNYHR